MCAGGTEEATWAEDGGYVGVCGRVKYSRQPRRTTVPGVREGWSPPTPRSHPLHQSIAPHRRSPPPLPPIPARPRTTETTNGVGPAGGREGGRGDVDAMQVSRSIHIRFRQPITYINFFFRILLVLWDSYLREGVALPTNLIRQ